MKTAFLFPGQGAQSIGMGKDLYDAHALARTMFDQAEAITALPLKKICFEGSEDELARTDIAQPAIFTVSAIMLACMSEALGSEKLAAIAPSCMAGLSLGEYTALYAAGAMDFATGLTLVMQRGALMQQAATAVPSGMVSIIGLDEAQAGELCAAAAGGEILTCANFNCPGQIVISGQIDACRRAETLAKDFGASGAVPLKVAGAFHSDIMKPAAQELGVALAAVDFAQPRVDVIANVDAAPYVCACQIGQKLLAQLVSPVRWQQSAEAMLAGGVERFYEIGPGRVLAGLMRRISRKTEVVCVNSKEAIEKMTA
jgi:[acyl-carrier-protein] S-malonyltransferase